MSLRFKWSKACFGDQTSFHTDEPSSVGQTALALFTIKRMPKVCAEANVAFYLVKLIPQEGLWPGFPDGHGEEIEEVL